MRVDDLPSAYQQRIQANPYTGCWLWTGAKHSDGYAVYRLKRVHRLVYEMQVGPIPEGLVVDHLCRVRHCVNPDHLEPVTVRTNTLRGAGLFAVRARQTHCVNGHELVGDNVYIHPQRGTRMCRVCMKATAAARRAGSTGKTCITDGCDRPGVSRGLCTSHYMEWYRSQ